MPRAVLSAGGQNVTGHLNIDELFRALGSGIILQGIWQNDANRCSLPNHALRFHPAAVELRNMFYDR
jgi:hypothetical protein